MTCRIRVEFHHPLHADQINQLRGMLANRLRALHPQPEDELWVSKPSDPTCANLGYSGWSVDPSGCLHDDEDEDRYAPVPGGQGVAAGALGGIDFLSRWWSEDYPEGPLPVYAVTMLTLLASPLVKRVWYTSCEKSPPSPITKEGVMQLLDRFIAVGHTHREGSP